MNYYNSLTILLFILFLFSLFYYIYKNKNTIIRYQTVKEYNDEDYNTSSLDNLYKRKTCDDYCSKNMCDYYEQKLDIIKNAVSVNQYFHVLIQFQMNVNRVYHLV